MGRVTVLLVILSCCVLLLVDSVRCIRYLSKDEDVSVDLNLKLFSTNIQIYDCVDIRKQLAFEHPLLKNHTVDSQTEMYPNGTIPVRKGHALEAKQQDNSIPNEFVAVAQTKIGRSKYAGGGGYIKINSPKAVGQQYSAASLRLQGGKDSIAVGWRVDPALYGDSQPRFFIHTDAGQSHCFGTRCPGFILIDHSFNLEYPLGKISQPGGEIWTLACHIIRNGANGNWNLLLGTNRNIVGYWPSSIFTGLKGLADYVEWGGAVYSPPGTPLPPMGSGTFPTGNVSLDGVVAKIEVLNEKAQLTDKFDIVTYATNPQLYSVRDGGEYVKMEHVILYGGPGH